MTIKNVLSYKTQQFIDTQAYKLKSFRKKYKIMFYDISPISWWRVRLMKFEMSNEEEKGQNDRRKGHLHSFS